MPLQNFPKSEMPKTFVVGSSLMLTSYESYHMLFLAPRAPRWAPFLRPGPMCDLQNTSSENLSTIDLVIKDASLAFKGQTLTLIFTSLHRGVLEARPY